MRAAIYARVSTVRDQSPGAQVSELRAFCQSRGWTVGGEFVDHGFTGKNDKRPELQSMLAAVRKRTVDVVVVVKLDRLFRSLRHVVTTLAELAELGVDFVAVRDHFDATTSSGRLMMHLVSAFAEFELDLIRERTRVGIENARAKGKTLGRPQTVDFQLITNLRDSGLSYREIQRRVGCSSWAVRQAVNGARKIPPRGEAEESTT